MDSTSFPNLIRGMETSDELKQFLKHLNPQEEKQFLEVAANLQSNLNQITQLVFADEDLDEENIIKHQNKLLNALRKGFLTNLNKRFISSFEDPSRSNLEGITESNKKKKTSDGEEEILKKITYITNHFLTYPKDEDMQSTITLKRQNGLIQVVGKTTGSLNIPEISQPTFAPDPKAKQKGKFATVISQINQLVQS